MADPLEIYRGGQVRGRAYGGFGGLAPPAKENFSCSPENFWFYERHKT